MSNPELSRVERVKYGAKETITLLAEGEDLTIYTTDDGGMVLECFNYGPKGGPHTGHRMTLNAGDKAKLRKLIA